MFTTMWSTSERRYDVIVERDVKVRMPDGILLDGDIYRPAANERFPVILGAHAYNKDLQSPPLRPVGFTPMRGYMESGDSTFYARRGYVHAVFNTRGSGKSEGFYQLMGPLEVDDICHVIDWLAVQPWSNGVVGMFGVSYYARLAKAVATTGPKPLKAIFSPFAGTDDYRHRCYHGGILAHGFITHWRNSLHRPNYRSLYKEQHGETAYREAIAQVMHDDEIMAVPTLREALQNPAAGTNALVVEVLLHPSMDSFGASAVRTMPTARSRRFSARAGATTGCTCRARSPPGPNGKGRRKWSLARRSISIVRFINIRTNPCAGSTIGSRGWTPTSWLSHRSAASFLRPANGNFSTTGRLPKLAGRDFTCTKMVY
jgi:X-Pro dipeptidyl-peptidase (S15 family)